MTRLLTYRPGLLFRYAFSPPRVFEMPLKHSIAYGVSAMIQIAKSSDSDPLSCKEICNRVQMPEGYVLQILRKLRMAGLLNSTRGVQGGYNLARPIDQISVMDVCDALGVQMRWECRTQGGMTTPDAGQDLATTQVMDSIASQVRSCLWDIKLSALL